MTANDGSNADLYGERHRNFSLKVLKMFNETDQNANLIMSPYSIDRVLLVAYFGAANQTKQSLEQLLCLDAADKQAVANSFHLETEARVGRDFVSADKVYIEDRVDLNGAFKHLFQRKTEECVVKMPFGENPDGCRIAINQFIENTTNGLIKNALRPGELDERTSLVLANAIYFNSVWSLKFKKRETSSKLFYGQTESWVKMMTRIGKFHYTKNDDLQFESVQLRYNGCGGCDGSAYMLIFLPFESSSVDEFLHRFTSEALNNVMQNTSDKVLLSLSLPKMKFERRCYMEEMLVRMGIGNLFRSDSPDFSDFSTTNRLRFSNIIHVAKVDVCEEGTKAAAVTVTCEYKSGFFFRGDPLCFNCNRPFVFMIYDGERNLFSGIYRDPQSMIVED